MNSKFELALYLFISEVMGSDESLEWVEYSDGYKGGSILIDGETDPIYINFSLPNKMDDCYLYISDGSAKELASQMAGLQEYNENTAHLCRDHTVPTDNEYMNKSGWYSYLITTPKVSYQDFPNSAEIEGRTITFRLALPLNEKEKEKEIKVHQGINALMDYLELSKRDTISFV